MKRKQQVYYLGYISDTIAEETGIMNGSIFMDESALNHIANTHKREFSKMGVSAMDFVSLVASGYTEIRQGSGNSLLLVVRKHPNNVLAIRLHCYPILHFYTVATAFPVTDKELRHYTILYKK